jgi:transposase
VETNATRMCALLVAMADVVVLAVDDQRREAICVHVEQRVERPVCAECGTAAWVKDRPVVELVDLGCFGRPARLMWHKHRWCCPELACPVGSWTSQDRRIAAPRLAMTDRAGRWATLQVGRQGRTVAEVARELGCDWHTVNDAVIAYGTPLVEDPARVGAVTAVGLDEVLFARQGPWRTQAWSTTIADVAAGRLLEVMEGRSAAGACPWFEQRPAGWCEQIAWAVLDLSGPWRLTFDTMLPWATQVADPFHLVKLANQRLDDVRRRVQNETPGPPGPQERSALPVPPAPHQGR